MIQFFSLLFIVLARPVVCVQGLTVERVTVPVKGDYNTSNFLLGFKAARLPGCYSKHYPSSLYPSMTPAVVRPIVWIGF